MDSHPGQDFYSFRAKKDFFIGIDSDGCVFDNMEIKHKKCFCPNFIRHFSLQPVSDIAREVWEFVNLYSKWRGINRFFALQRAFALLGERTEICSGSINDAVLKAWTDEHGRLSSTTISEYIDDNPDCDPFMYKCRDWSLAVDVSIREIVRNIQPFPRLTDCLERAVSRADLMVISSTPCEALLREWQKHALYGYPSLIAGSEMGSKDEQLNRAAKPNYKRENILMIGDSPGDESAAKSIGAVFYPIVPGNEVMCWERFHDEALELFFDGKFQGEYQGSLLHDFHECLPERPDWEARV